MDCLFAPETFFIFFFVSGLSLLFILKLLSLLERVRSPHLHIKFHYLISPLSVAVAKNVWDGNCIFTHLLTWFTHRDITDVFGWVAIHSSHCVVIMIDLRVFNSFLPPCLMMGQLSRSKIRGWCMENFHTQSLYTHLYLTARKKGIQGVGKLFLAVHEAAAAAWLVEGAKGRKNYHTHRVWY